MNELCFIPKDKGSEFSINLGPQEYRRNFTLGAYIQIDDMQEHLLGSVSSKTGNEATWKIEHPNVSGTYKVTQDGTTLRVTYDLKVHNEVSIISPCVIRIHSNDGMLLLPGEEQPFDPADYRHAGRTISFQGTAAWALSSQTGFLVRNADGDAPTNLMIARAGELSWDVALQHRSTPKGSLSGEIEIISVPFNGALTLDYLLQHAGLQDQPRTSVSKLNDITHIEEKAPGEWQCVLDGQLLSVSIQSNQSSDFDTFQIKSIKEKWNEDEFWKVTVTRPSGNAMDSLRLEATIETPCGNPTWEGNATVFIPGNMARCNYHPNHLHGGGPKWGPSSMPEREEKTANDEAPGRCHGWTFAASRLPQVWACAADRDSKKLVWIGTDPKSQLGETCAGFVSPAGRTTTLKLATPTTYEPWVPLGYSRMRQEPRRDTAQIESDQPFEWTFYVAVREADDLNGWAPLERALYLRNRPKQPTPVKMSYKDAAMICASAIFERFYNKERGVISYSTGPQGQNTIVGFTGMAHSALVMLRAGQRFKKNDWVDAGKHILHTVSAMFLEGPEFPWTAVPAGKIAGEEDSFVHGSGEPGYVVMAAFDGLAEAYLVEKNNGHDVSEWRHALRKCADAWVNNQAPDGAYPHWGPGFASAFEENEYGVTNVEAGVLANMADAYEIFGDERYLDSAKRAAVFYGKQLDNGQLWGGPGDIRALVNSEVPMYFLRGYRRLYEVTGDEEHKRLMLLSAAWRYSFQFAHSWPCEPNSPLFKQGWAGLGSENASSCNLHSVAFGCVNVPDMWALWKITGDEYHRMRCEDLALYSKQQYARFAGDLGFPFAGAGTESWWTSDTVWGKGYPWIFTDPGFDLGYMSWVTGWSGYGALWAEELFS